MESLTLFQLNDYIRQVVVLNFNTPLWVTCEISQLNVSRGHRYLELIQKDPKTENIIARIGAVIWARDYDTLNKRHEATLSKVLAESNQVRVQVKVDFHERFGLKVMIKDVDLNFTLGQFAERRLQIIKQLESEKLLGLNSQLSWPFSLQRVAVISSKTAAGLADFMAQLAENEFGYDFRVKLWPAAMQGTQVVPEIMAQLQEIFQRREEYDVVVIIRGGGSKIDLADFDSYELGKMIATFPLPVFTGIGHEIDESIVDMVSAQSFKTPTAVASYLIQYHVEQEQTMFRLVDDIRQLVARQIQEQQANIDNYGRLMPLLASSLVERAQWDVAQLERSFKFQLMQTFQQKTTKLSHLLEMIETTRPERILKKGYSITYLNGQPVRSSSQLKIGDQVETVVETGSFHSTITKLTK